MVAASNSREKARLAKALSFASQLDRIVGDNMVGRWEFDDCSGAVASDSSGFAYNGSLVGSPTWSTDTPAVRGCSLSFDGTNGVSIPDKDVLDIGTGSATRTAWFKTSQSSAMTIVRKSDGTNANGFYVYIAGGIINCALNNAPSASVGTSGAYNNGLWHHVACIIDRTANLMSIYVDGVLRGSADISALSGIDLNAVAPVIIPPSSSGLIGLIDSVHFFSKALTANEIGKLYAEGLKKHKIANLK
jgi:hypothetical protein